MRDDLVYVQEKLRGFWHIDAPRVSVASVDGSGGVPPDMFDSEVDEEGWVEWKMLPSTLTNDDIAKLEAEFCIQFPPLFRAYLLAGFQLFDQIHSVKYEQLIFNTDVPSNDPLGPIRALMEAWKQLLSANYIPFAQWGDGWGPMCFDTENRDDNGDCPVVWMDHELLIPLGKECGNRAAVLPHVNALYESYAEFFEDVFDTTPSESPEHMDDVETAEPKLIVQLEPNNEFAAAARDGNIGLVREFLADGIHPDTPNTAWSTPLERAVCSGHQEIALLLLDSGASPNPIEIEPFSSALVEAVIIEDEVLVEALLKHGADPNLRVSKDRRTALIIASSMEASARVVKLLLEHGADPGIEDRNGDTALSVAEGLGYKEIATLLKARG